MLNRSIRSNRKKGKKSEDSATKSTIKSSMKSSVKKRSSGTKRSERARKGSRRNKMSARSKSVSSADGSPKRIKAKEAWAAEEHAKKIVASGVFNETTIVNEFKSAGSPKPSDADSGVFQTNLAKNRLKEWPISDEKLFKFTAPPNNYISAARITIAEGKRMIVAQLPDPTDAGQVEDFWRMVFQEECLSVVVCSTCSELPNLEQLFPITANSFANIGKMFIQTRKVDKDSSIHVFQLELLPDGCSNSIYSNVYHVANWQKQKEPECGYGALVSTLDKILKANTTACLVSHSGVGRCGTMAVMLAAMLQMEQQKELNVKEILEKLRGDRSGVVESSEQYVAIYKALVWWIKVKATDEETLKKIDKMTDFVPKA